MPLEPLARHLEAWLTLPSPSSWLTHTIRLGYVIQFTRRPPKFNGVLETSVEVRNAPVMREEIAVLLAKGAIKPVPPAEMRQGFHSPYFIVPKKGGGHRPILDRQVLNRALHKPRLNMLMRRRIIKCTQPQDWFCERSTWRTLTVMFWSFVPTVCIRGSGMAVQGPPLWALPVSPCLYEGHRGRPYPATGSGRQGPQLPRQLAYLGPISRAVVRSQGLGAAAPQPVGASGQLGKEQALWVNITQECRRSFNPWTDLAFLRAGVPLEQVSRHTVVTTDASSTGWGNICNGQAASELRTGPRLLWYINCLELWALHLALWQFRPLLLGKHVLVRMDNTAAVSYINRLGGIRSRRMSQLARHLLLWSHTQLKSLRAAHIPWKLNRVVDALSQQLTFPGEWRLHPETIGLIWSRFGEAQGDLFASHESSHCQLYFFPDRGPPQHGCTGTHLSSGFTQVCISPSEPTRTDTVHAQGGWGAGPPLSGARHHMAPASRSVEPPCVVPGWDAADLSGLPLAVVETITQTRAPSTRQNYALNWCSSHREDPQRCTIGVVFSFLQERLERRLSPSTLKVYVAAIVAHHDAVDGQSLGKQDLILKGARRMNLGTSWHLSIVLAGLQRGPFGPLDSCQLRQRSWPRSLPSKGSGTSKHFR